jgi:ATP-dependent DNA ligase
VAAKLRARSFTMDGEAAVSRADGVAVFEALHPPARDARRGPPCVRPAGATVFQHACRFGLEGIVSKRLGAPYRSGPSRDWLRVKNPDSPAMRRAREGRW